MSPIPTCSSTCTGRSRSAASSPGSPTSRWPRLNRALDTPGISARHRARLFVLGARTYSSHGELEKAGQLATTALAGGHGGQRDNWAIAWALHVLTIVTTMQGQLADALPLFDRALAVTEADPALTDLRLLLQINKAVSLAALDRYEEAFARGPARRASGAPARCRRPAGAGADRAGPAVLRHRAMGRCRHRAVDEAVADVETAAWPEHAAACSDLGIAAVICFHRGDLAAARRHLAAAAAACRADGQPRDRPAGARPKPGPRASRPAAGGACRADRRVRRQHRGTRGDRGPARRRRAPCHEDRRPRHRAGPRRSRRSAGRWISRSRTGRRTPCTAAACWTTTPPSC